MNKVLKRGYWKWTDENGVRHKEKDVGQYDNQPELELTEEDFPDVGE